MEYTRSYDNEHLRDNEIIDDRPDDDRPDDDRPDDDRPDDDEQNYREEVKQQEQNTEQEPAPVQTNTDDDSDENVDPEEVVTERKNKMRELQTFITSNEHSGIDAIKNAVEDARKELKELEQADANNENRRINKNIIKTVRSRIELSLPKAIEEVLNDAFDLQEKRKQEKEERERKLEQAITDKRKSIQDVYAIMTEAKSNLEKNVDSLINYNSIVADICNDSGKSESQRLDEIKAKRQALSEAIEFIRNNIALINNSIDLVSTIDPVVNSKQE